VKDSTQSFNVANPDCFKDLRPRVRRIEAHEVYDIHTKALCQRKEGGYGREATASLDLTEMRFA
jgi:hypothetical protein